MSLEPPNTGYKPAGAGGAELDPSGPRRPASAGGVGGWAERSPRTPGRPSALLPLDKRPSLAAAESPSEGRPPTLLVVPAAESRPATAEPVSPGEPRRVAVGVTALARLQDLLATMPPHIRATYNHASRVIQRAYRQFRMRRVLAMTMVERQRQAAIREQVADNSGLSAIAAGRRKSFSQF